MIIITCASLSGGQGKSTIALFLSRKLASLGYPTVTVDADPQNNLTTWLGVDLDGNSPSFLDVLKKQVTIYYSLYLINHNLYLLPSYFSLILEIQTHTKGHVARRDPKPPSPPTAPAQWRCCAAIEQPTMLCCGGEEGREGVIQGSAVSEYGGEIEEG